jgi:hypothetical protein
MSEMLMLLARHCCIRACGALNQEKGSLASQIT